MVSQANLYLHQLVNAAAAAVSLEQASQYKIIKYRHCIVVAILFWRFILGAIKLAIR